MRTTDAQREFLYWRKCKELAATRSVQALKNLQRVFLLQKSYEKADIIAGALWVKTNGTMGL